MSDGPAGSRGANGLERESSTFMGGSGSAPKRLPGALAGARSLPTRLLAFVTRGREWKSRTLIAIFLVLTVGILVGLALVIGSQISSSIRAESLRGAQQSAAVFFFIGLEPNDYAEGRLRPGAYGELDENAREAGVVLGARVWDSEDGLLHDSSVSEAASPAEPTLTLRTAFREGERRSELISGPLEEVRTYLPVPAGRQGRTVQVVELRLAGQPVAEQISTRRTRLYVILFATAALLYLALLPTVVKGSRALAERYRASHLGLQRELRRALDQNELMLHYQPKLDLHSGKVHGVEALLRWNHPNRGIVPPLEFIPAAEETSLALPLTVRVFELAFARLSEWQRQRIDLSVAINVSPGVLADPQFPREVERLLADHEIQAGDVTLEITESALGQAQTLPVLPHLRSLGFKLSIDDFGTGHSSLVRLDTLPIDELKIDRTFIRKMGERGSSTLVAGMISLAHELRLAVVAEGVETGEMLERLIEFGCDSIQGFYLARPLPEAEVASWLLSAQAKPKPFARSARAEETS
jgi:EAL domain-containing protein (putative c-di-GMP-specific phosphodiesterase class I)